MNRRWSWIATIPPLLAGCQTATLPKAAYTSTPMRWPDNVETCGITVSVFPKWHKAITWTTYPSARVYHDAGWGECAGKAHDERVIQMEPKEAISLKQMSVDHGSGGWNDYAVHYQLRMGPANVFSSYDQFINPYHQHAVPAASGLPPRWVFNQPLGQVDTFVVNGLKWKRFVFYSFNSYLPDLDKQGIPAQTRDGQLLPLPTIHTPHPNALTWVGEVYALQVDATHQMKIWANYMRPVVQDAHWLKVRRAMLRKLVDAVTVQSVTEAQLAQLRNLARVQQDCYAGNVEACKQGGLRTEYAR